MEKKEETPFTVSEFTDESFPLISEFPLFSKIFGNKNVSNLVQSGRK
jgi:hypothetical protein